MQSAVVHEQVIPSVASSVFVVPHGTARTDEGRRRAAALLSRSPQEEDLVRRGVHPDLIELSPAKGKAKIGIDQVREVIHQAQFAPTQASQKVCLVPQAEGLTPEAANALLKVLEEPPRGLVFIFLVENPGDLLPTIVSRSRVVRMRPTGNDAILSRLAEAGYEATEAAYIADIVENEAELAEFIGGTVELASRMKEAVAAVSEATADGLLKLAIGGDSIASDSIARDAAVTCLLSRLIGGDVELAVTGARSLARAGIDAAQRLLSLLLTKVFASFTGRSESLDVKAKGTGSLASLRMNAKDGVWLCRRIERAQRAVERYTPLEAVFLSLFLSVCEVQDE